METDFDFLTIKNIEIVQRHQKDSLSLLNLAQK